MESRHPFQILAVTSVALACCIACKHNADERSVSTGSWQAEVGPRRPRGIYGYTSSQGVSLANDLAAPQGLEARYADPDFFFASNPLKSALIV